MCAVPCWAQFFASTCIQLLGLSSCQNVIAYSHQGGHKYNLCRYCWDAFRMDGNQRHQGSVTSDSFPGADIMEARPSPQFDDIVLWHLRNSQAQMWCLQVGSPTHNEGDTWCASIQSRGLYFWHDQDTQWCLCQPDFIQDQVHAAKVQEHCWRPRCSSHLVGQGCVYNSSHGLFNSFFKT